MGIDIYMKWSGQSESERMSQMTGFSVVSGNLGYLREAYHGEPYATRLLVPEAFAADDCQAKIPAKTLRERLPAVIEAAVTREMTVYKTPFVTETHPTVAAFVEFVRLAEEKEKETGEPVTIYASY